MSKEFTHKQTICVFCGSLFGSLQVYADAAQQLGEALAARNWGLVYGGGSTGLMGAVARSCATNGGYVHGILPEAMISRERVDEAESIHSGQSSGRNSPELKNGVDIHHGFTPLPDSKEYGYTTLVKDMHTRKRLMAQEALAFVALPGGYGTLEELMEMVTWAQLNIHSKPIVIFNINGFYDAFLKFLDSAIAAQFISAQNGEIIKVGNTVEQVLEAIEEYKTPEGVYKMTWDSI